QRDIDAAVEGERLDGNERLVVIHGHGGVIGAARLDVEERIGGVRARHHNALGGHGVDRRLDDLDLLATDAPVFAGVWVEASDGDARPGDAKVADEGRRGDPWRIGETLGCQRARYGGERNVYRGRHDLQFLSHQHHDGQGPRLSAVPQGQFGQELRVTWIRQFDAIKRALNNGIGDDGKRLPGGDGRDSGFDGRDDRPGFVPRWGGLHRPDA